MLAARWPKLKLGLVERKAISNRLGFVSHQHYNTIENDSENFDVVGSCARLVPYIYTFIYTRVLLAMWMLFEDVREARDLI